jgi:hypothetical protein
MLIAYTTPLPLYLEAHSNFADMVMLIAKEFSLHYLSSKIILMNYRPVKKVR